MSAQPVRDKELPAGDLADSPGKRLRIARQAKGLTLERVATQLHLSLPMVQALESDDFERLPGAVFVRGYLRNYARLVEADEGAVLQAYHARQPAPPSGPPGRVGASLQPEIRSSHIGVRLVSWTLILGLVALLGIWWQGNFDFSDLGNDDSRSTQDRLDSPPVLADASVAELERPTTPEPPSPTPVGNLGAPPSPSTPETPPPAPASSVPPAAAPSPVAAPMETTPIAATQPPSAIPPEEPPSPPKVVFEFTGPCWVDIRDSTGKFKLIREMRKGDVQNLEGTPPFSVRLGNRTNVQIRIDGEPFEIPVKGRGSRARFTLDPSTVGAASATPAGNPAN